MEVDSKKYVIARRGKRRISPKTVIGNLGFIRKSRIANLSNGN
jgi:hypothetical protein